MDDWEGVVNHDFFVVVVTSILIWLVYQRKRIDDVDLGVVVIAIFVKIKIVIRVAKNFKEIVSII